MGGRRDGKAGGLSARTRRHIHRILRSALARAVEQQIIARNPADFSKQKTSSESRAARTDDTDRGTVSATPPGNRP
jgi:hypothetical protein